MPDSYTPDTTITVTLDSELLNEVQSILDEIGIDMETAMVMYLEEIARKKEILLKLLQMLVCNGLSEF